MCSHNEACFRYDGYFQYHCPAYGLAGPRAKRAEKAMLGLIAAGGRQVHRRQDEPGRSRKLSLHGALV